MLVELESLTCLVPYILIIFNLDIEFLVIAGSAEAFSRALRRWTRKSTS